MSLFLLAFESWDWFFTIVGSITLGVLLGRML